METPLIPPALPDASPSGPAGEVPSPPPLPATEAAPTLPFRFHGDAREYFSIWITNTLLTIATCGIYAAWAKVRRRRYFRGCLELEGHRFHYTASPIRLLIGNLIVVALFLAYSLFGSVYPLVRLGAIVVFLAALPWIIVRSYSFNAHHTVYRGLRFRFQPSLSHATVAYLGHGLVAILTCAIYYPNWSHAKRRFQYSRHRYGTSYFRFGATPVQFWEAYGPAIPIVIAAVVLMGVFTALAAFRGWSQTVVLVYVFAAYIPALYVARQVAHARLFNVIWNNLKLDESSFVATLHTGRWLRLQLGNWAAIIGSAGLAYPWAAIRTARYMASCLAFQPQPEFYQTRHLFGGDGSAIGDTAAEFAGMDFGL